jgi:hypothetical protein
MKNKLLSVIAISFISSSAMALEDIKKDTNIEREIGLYASNIEYEEPGVMKQDGTMVGVIGSWAYRGDFVTKIDGSYAEGEVDYQNSGTMNDIDDYIVEIRGSVGKDFYTESGVRVTPMIGYGYRYLNDDMGGRQTSTSAWGYEREQEYLYTPIAVEFRGIKTNSNWEIGGIIEYDYFWDGTNNSNMGYISSAYYDIELDQDDGKGYRFSLRFSNENANDSSKIIIEPFYRYWHIEDSKVTTDPGNTSWTEPNNTSKEVGVSVIATF